MSAESWFLLGVGATVVAFLCMGFGIECAESTAVKDIDAMGCTRMKGRTFDCKGRAK